MFSLEVLEYAVFAGGIVVAICFVALLVARRHIDYGRSEVETAVLRLEPVLQAWLVLERDEDTDRVRSMLRGMSPYAAFRSLARLATQQVTFERQQFSPRPYAESLGSRPSQARAVEAWWRRSTPRDCCASLAGEEDGDLIARLIDDKSPAVRLVAMDAAARLKGSPLVDTSSRHYRCDRTPYRHTRLPRCLVIRVLSPRR